MQALRHYGTTLVFQRLFLGSYLQSLEVLHLHSQLAFLSFFFDIPLASLHSVHGKERCERLEKQASIKRQSCG